MDAVVDGEIVDFDHMCMYEFFSKYHYTYTNRMKQLRRRRRDAVVIPSPSLKPDVNNDRWCYQMLMMFTPFRKHDEVMFHPNDRDLSSFLHDDDTQPADASPTNPVDSVQHASATLCESEDEELPGTQTEGTRIIERSDTLMPAGAAVISRAVEEEEMPESPEQIGDQAQDQWESSSSASDLSDRDNEHAVMDSCSAIDDSVAGLSDHHCHYPTDPQGVSSNVMVIEEESTGELSDQDGELITNDPLHITYERPYKSARDLLLLLTMTKCIDPLYMQTSNALALLGQCMKDAFKDHATVPTEAEILALLHSLTGEPELMCGPELAHMFHMDESMRVNRNLVNADDIENRFFHGTHYEDDIRQFKDAHSAATTNELMVQVDNPELTVQDDLRKLEQAIQDVKTYSGRYRTLKLRQMIALLTVLDAIKSILQRKHSVNRTVDIRDCHLILQGGAGTGKTYILRHIVDLICFFLGRHSVRVFAPTAQVAKAYQDLPCGASTLHKMWHKSWNGSNSLYDNSCTTAPLNGSTQHKFINAMKDVQVLICDEMSLMSPTDIDMINRRLHEVHPDSTEDFPGMNIVILAGDLSQLPPVKQFALYRGYIDIAEETLNKKRKYPNKSAGEIACLVEPKKYHNEGTRVYRDFFDKCIILNENVRQQQDPEWQYLLKHVRNGTATEEDVHNLNLRVFTPSVYDPNDRSYQPEFKTCKRFLPTNAAVHEQGVKMFQELFPNQETRFDASPLIQINRTVLQPEQVRKYGPEVIKLTYPLHLAVDAPVMLTTNIEGARDWGIVNGSTGRVAGYITHTGSKIKYLLFQADEVLPGMPPLRIKPPGAADVIEFRDTWPVEMVSSTVIPTVKNGLKQPLVIERFPLQLAYALTIHKAQGTTIDYAVIDVAGTRGLAGQLVYVALSRVKTRMGLLLLHPVTMEDVNRFQNWKEKGNVLDEFARLEELQAKCIRAMKFTQQDRDLCNNLAEQERLML